jgi:hypothetical protein
MVRRERAGHAVVRRAEGARDGEETDTSGLLTRLPH